MLIYIKDNWKKREKRAIYKMFQLRVDFSLIFFPNNTFTTFLKEFLLRYQKFRIMNHYHGGQNVLLRSCVSMSCAPRKLYRKFGGTNSAISYRSRWHGGKCETALKRHDGALFHGRVR